MSACFYRKKLSQAGVFPLKLQDDELQWKITLDYDGEKDTFILYINDLAFLELPYQAEIAPTGP